MINERAIKKINAIIFTPLSANFTKTTAEKNPPHYVLGRIFTLLLRVQKGAEYKQANELLRSPQDMADSYF